MDLFWRKLKELTTLERRLLTAVVSVWFMRFKFEPQEILKSGAKPKTSLSLIKDDLSVNMLRENFQ